MIDKCFSNKKKYLIPEVNNGIPRKSYSTHAHSQLMLVYQQGILR